MNPVKNSYVVVLKLVFLIMMRSLNLWRKLRREDPSMEIMP
jgi:hypothetical protein